MGDHMLKLMAEGKLFLYKMFPEALVRLSERDVKGKEILRKDGA